MNNSAFQPAKPPKRPQQYTNDSILEALRDLGGGVGKTVTHDVVGKVGSDALASLFGTMPKQGEMHPNEAISLPKEQPPAPTHQPEVRPATRVPIHEDSQKIQQQIEAVRSEL